MLLSCAGEMLVTRSNVFSTWRKKGLALAKRSVEPVFAFAHASNTGLRSPNRNTKKKPRMKKIILLAAVIGFASVMTSVAADAKENWEKSCAKCHGADGKGQTKMGQKLGIKDYTDAKVQADLKDEAATKAIKEGLKDKDGKTLMKPAEGLTDDEVKGLVAHVRSFKK
jgi:cytochrome c553